MTKFNSYTTELRRIIHILYDTDNLRGNNNDSLDLRYIFIIILTEEEAPTKIIAEALNCKQRSISKAQKKAQDQKEVNQDFQEKFNRIKREFLIFKSQRVATELRNLQLATNVARY